MIALSPGGRVYLACGVTDMRKGAVGLAMLVQQSLLENPFDGSVYAFRGRRSGLIKLIWHDGIGLCMLTKRLERGQFPADPFPRAAAAVPVPCAAASFDFGVPTLQRFGRCVTLAPLC